MYKHTLRKKTTTTKRKQQYQQKTKEGAKEEEEEEWKIKYIYMQRAQDVSAREKGRQEREGGGWTEKERV